MNVRRIFALVGLGAVILSGCLGQPEWYGTPGVGDANVDVFATQAAVDVHLQQSHLDATAQVSAIQATAAAMAADAEIQRAAGTRQAAAATSAAWDRYVQSTETAAHATAQVEAARFETAEARRVAETAEARRIEETRQAVAIEATRQRAQWEQDATATAWAREDMATQEAHYATRQAESTAVVVQATQQSHQATATRMAAVREERLGAARDYGLPIILLLLVGGAVGLVVWGLRQWAKKPVVCERSLLGDAPLLTSQVQGGGYTLLDPDRQPSAAITVLPNGEVHAPQLRSPGQEERTTARDQMLDAASRPRLGAGHSGPVPQLAADPPQAPVPGLTGVRIVRRLDQAETAGLLPPGQVEAIETVWKETEED